MNLTTKSIGGCVSQQHCSERNVGRVIVPVLLQCCCVHVDVGAIKQLLILLLFESPVECPNAAQKAVWDSCNQIETSTRNLSTVGWGQPVPFWYALVPLV
jgi:hypothetical protein